MTRHINELLSGISSCHRPSIFQTFYYPIYTPVLFDLEKYKPWKMPYCFVHKSELSNLWQLQLQYYGDDWKWQSYLSCTEVPSVGSDNNEPLSFVAFSFRHYFRFSLVLFHFIAVGYLSLRIHHKTYIWQHCNEPICYQIRKFEVRGRVYPVVKYTYITVNLSLYILYVTQEKLLFAEDSIVIMFAKGWRWSIGLCKKLWHHTWNIAI